MQMRKMIFLLAAVLGAVVSAPAGAADMPVKAPVPVILSYSGSGWYAGLHTFGETDSANVSGPSGVAVGGFTAGGSIGPTVGWMRGNGTTWFSVQGMASWQNLDSQTNANILAPGSISSKVGFTGRAMLGGPMANFLSYLPSLGSAFPALPVPTIPTVGTNHPYLFYAAHVDDVSADYMLGRAKAWQFRSGLGAGVMAQLGKAGGGGSPVVGDFWAEYLVPASSTTIGLPSGTTSAKGNLGGGARVGVSLYYGIN